MENMTVSGLVMAVANATSDSASPAVHDAGGAHTILTILLVGVALFIVFTCCGLPMLGFVSTGIAAGSIAAAWMGSIGVVAAGSLFALLQAIAMGGVPLVMVLLGIVAVVAAAWGVFEAIVWLVHGGWWHWLLQVGHSAIDWVDLQGLWHSATDWVVHLWGSIPAHHKWKILYT